MAVHPTVFSAGSWHASIVCPWFRVVCNEEEIGKNAIATGKLFHEPAAAKAIIVATKPVILQQDGKRRFCINTLAEHGPVYGYCIGRDEQQRKPGCPVIVMELFISFKNGKQTEWFFLGEAVGARVPCRMQSIGKNVCKSHDMTGQDMVSEEPMIWVSNFSL
ncbi:MAG: hypothetical protein CMJ42_05215 [Phyllobacteriaceae bacterium]|nr:hypothetical protein [Phyllobacteriaceae bacterium]MBA91219.1 hypothetical protein [Phyllobacteriaceae bacterium]